MTTQTAAGPVQVRPRQPVVLEAWQVTAENAEAVARWSRGTYCDDGSVMLIREDGDTPDWAVPGDYVMRGTTGHHFVLMSEAYTEHYEELPR